MDAWVEVRFGTTGDADQLAQMLHDFNLEFGDPSPGVEILQRRVSTLIEDGRMTYLVAGNGPDGFAQISFRPSVWAKEPVGYIEELYVKPDLRGRGIGNALMTAIFDECHRRKAPGIELVTGEDDTGARALYEKFGFKNEIEGTKNARSLFYEINF